MSVYTTEVRYICETEAGLNESVGFNSVDAVIESAVDKVFDFSFPIWDENYRKVLEAKILKHYYLREICAETVGLWKLYLSRRLNEIMPYYNKLYETTTYQFDPIMDVNYQRKYDKTGTEKDVGNGTNVVTDTAKEIGTSTTNNQGTSWNLFSDTPQGGLENVDSEEYLTTATKNTNNSSVNLTNNNDVTRNGNTQYTDNRDINTTDKYVETVTGKTAGRSYASLINEYRNTLINIDMMIIDELKDLFMLIW